MVLYILHIKFEKLSIRLIKQKNIFDSSIFSRFLRIITTLYVKTKNKGKEEHVFAMQGTEKVVFINIWISYRNAWC